MAAISARVVRCVRASVSLRLLCECVEQGGEGGSGGDLASADERGNVCQRYPADVVGLEVVFGRTDALGAVGEVNMMHRVGDARGGLDAQERDQGARPPAGLLLGLPGGGACGVFTGVDLANGDLPSPGVGDEAVPP